jgi:hypothetical protein
LPIAFPGYLLFLPHFSNPEQYCFTSQINLYRETLLQLLSGFRCSWMAGRDLAEITIHPVEMKNLDLKAETGVTREGRGALELSPTGSGRS